MIASDISMTGPAFSSSLAGPWICAAVASPVKPSTVTTQETVFASVSTVTSAVPVAVLSVGGTSAPAVRSVLYFTVSAKAGSASAVQAATATAVYLKLGINILNPSLWFL